MTLSEAHECLSKGCIVRQASAPDVYLVANTSARVIALGNIHNEAVKGIITKYGLDKATVAPNVTAVVVTESEVVLEAFIPSQSQFWADDYECVECTCQEAPAETATAPEDSTNTEETATDKV